MPLPLGPQTPLTRTDLLRERPVKWDPSYDLTTGTITVHVTRKAVKNFNLRVRSDGTAVMSIPWQTNRQKAQAFLDKHRYWLKRSIAQVLEKQPEAPDDGLVPLWGRLIDLPCDLAVDELYHREVTQALPALIKIYEEATGQHATAWRLRDLTSRWGSCTPSTGHISINIRLAAYPPICLEYVVAHELTHFIEPSHNNRFHLHLALVFPEEQKARALLKRNPREVADAGASPADRIPVIV